MCGVGGLLPVSVCGVWGLLPASVCGVGGLLPASVCGVWGLLPASVGGLLPCAEAGGEEDCLLPAASEGCAGDNVDCLSSCLADCGRGLVTFSSRLDSRLT